MTAVTLMRASAQLHSVGPLHVRRHDAARRAFSGIATTPTPDAYGDVIEPRGASFKLPVPLLLHHLPTMPVGNVTAADVRSDGIRVQMQLESTDAPGPLRDRLEEAWESVQLGLIRGLSIGFRPLEAKPLQNGRGMHFLKWAWHELSLVVIPANADCGLAGAKSAVPATPGRGAIPLISSRHAR